MKISGTIPEMIEEIKKGIMKAVEQAKAMSLKYVSIGGWSAGAQLILQVRLKLILINYNVGCKSAEYGGCILQLMYDM